MKPEQILKMYKALQLISTDEHYCDGCINFIDRLVPRLEKAWNTRPDGGDSLREALENCVKALDLLKTGYGTIVAKHCWQPLVQAKSALTAPVAKDGGDSPAQTEALREALELIGRLTYALDQQDAHFGTYGDLVKEGMAFIAAKDG